DEIPRFLASVDQPTVDGANTFVVSQAARRAGLTVALSGLGGDELFGGYASFRDVPRSGTLRSRLRPLSPIAPLRPPPLRRAPARRNGRGAAAPAHTPPPPPPPAGGPPPPPARAGRPTRCPTAAPHPAVSPAKPLRNFSRKPTIPMRRTRSPASNSAATCAT